MQKQNTSTDEITKKVIGIVDTLPQRGALVESDVKFWISEVVGKYGQLAIWHATRAGGFGGSQIGGLVKNFMGERADHDQSAHDIVAGTLLRKIPEDPNSHMGRGIAMEPQHRRWFQEKYMAQRDDSGFKTLSQSVGQKIWMRYSPDDLVFIDSASGPKRYLIDYKAPSSVEQDAKVAFQYVCQLHMGKLVCEQNGLKVDSLMLSQFDWANWALKDDMVPYLPELDQLIEEAGDHYWAFAMRGELPPYVRKPRLKEEEDLRKQLGGDALKLARLKALASAVKKHIEDVEVKVKPELEKFHFGPAQVKLAGISYTASPKFSSAEVLKNLPIEVVDSLPIKKASSTIYDTPALVRKLKELQVDVKPFVNPGSIDSDALYEALVAHGVDADALMSESLTGRIDKKLTAEVQSWFEREFGELLSGAGDLNVVAADASTQVDGREAQDEVRYAERSVSA